MIKETVYILLINLNVTLVSKFKSETCLFVPFLEPKLS